MASGTIKQQMPIMNIYYTDTTLAANTDHVQITASSHSGYTFWYWINAHTTGWVDGLFIEDPTSATTNVWRNNGSSSPTISQGGSVYALAMYRRLGS